MLLERFESAGLAHYSYLIGDGGEAVVIDPRRDALAYVQRAARAGQRITAILETHRHEDFVVGSGELVALTGARILRSALDELAYPNGERIADGQELPVGSLRLRAIHTPGHTLGHMSYLLLDASGAPWILFSGDALFAGDVGRCDFYGPERVKELAGKLYDSLFQRLLPLGDGVIVAPAHGAGSACGTAIAERPWTSIGLERALNPLLQVKDRDEFVRRAGRMLEYPPYFRHMEKLNLEGAPLLSSVGPPALLGPDEFASRAASAWVLDVRSTLAFQGAHIPGAISIYDDGLPGWPGRLLDYERPILLVADGEVAVQQAVTALASIGMDQVDGVLRDGMAAWLSAGKTWERTPTVSVRELQSRLGDEKDAWVVDVRRDEEVLREPLPSASHIPLSDLPSRLGEVPRNKPVYLLCASGQRATTAASLLQRGGWRNVSVVLGGAEAWLAGITGRPA